MSAIAKRLVQGLPAPAQPDGGPARQIERLSFRVMNRKLALNLNRPVVINCDLRWHALTMLTCEVKMTRLLLLLSLLGIAPAADLTFIQMSDPQFGMFAENRNFTQETANYEKAIADANRLKPAFVIVCGDLVNQAGNAAQIAEYKRISAQLSPAIKLYSVAGNHDVGNEPTPESLAAYRNQFGPDSYTFRHGDFLGIVLDSSLIQHPKSAPGEEAKQLQWLESELKKITPGTQVVLFQHIPWFLKYDDEPDDYFNIPLGPRTRYLKLFEKYKVHYGFAGHYHRNSYGESPTFHIVTTGPVGKPLGPDPSGIRIVTVQGPKITSEYRPL
jgi:predicted phosphodiesterase